MLYIIDKKLEENCIKKHEAVRRVFLNILIWYLTINQLKQLPYYLSFPEFQNLF